MSTQMWAGLFLELMAHFAEMFTVIYYSPMTFYVEVPG